MMAVAVPFSEKKKLSVKFEFGRVQFEHSPRLMALEKVAKEAFSYLQDYASVEINVMDEDKRFNFTSQIYQMDKGLIWIILPSSITETERRIQKRLRTNFLNSVFFNADWRRDESDLDSPVVFDTYRPLGNWILAVDISADGLCIESPFPAFFNWTSSNPVFEHAEVIFPMEKPCRVKAELRWVKRIREHQKTNTTNPVALYKYLAGLQITQKDQRYNQLFAAIAEKLKDF